MEMKKKMTIREALRAPHIRRALAALEGCPVGGWAETIQAVCALSGECPRRSERDWTVGELIDAALERDHAHRYRLRAAAGEE